MPTKPEQTGSISNMSNLSSPSSKTLKNSIALHLIWSAYVLLLLMMIVTSLPGIVPDGSSPWLILIIKLSPLLLVLPGMAMDSLRAHTWLCFIVLFYFTQSVVEAFLSLGATIDLFITLLTIVIFLSAMLYIKWERNLGRQLF
jgi:uncharacterized membrane protein